MTLSKQQISTLRTIPYLNFDELDGRIVKIMPLWDGARWHMWTSTDMGLLPLAIVDAHDIDYVAKVAAHSTDINIPFVETMWQHLSWREVSPKISAIAADFHNFGTSIEKLDFFFRHRESSGLASEHVVRTELEYLFILSRSVFDLLQETFSWIWKNTVHLDDPVLEAKRKSKALPETFSKMILDGGLVRTVDALIGEHTIPRALAEAYANSAEFFAGVRKLRDSIIHSGKNVGYVIETDRGFCIHRDAPAFKDMPFWKPEHEHNARLRSLLPLLSYVVVGTIETCNRLMAAFKKDFHLPAPIAPEYRVFVRAPHNDALLWMMKVAKGASPWFCDRQSLQLNEIRTRAYLHWKEQTGTHWWDPDANWLQAERDVIRQRPEGTLMRVPLNSV